MLQELPAQNGANSRTGSWAAGSVVCIPSIAPSSTCTTRFLFLSAKKASASTRWPPLRPASKNPCRGRDPKLAKVFICSVFSIYSCVIKVIVNCVSFSRDYFKPRRRRRVGLQPLQRTDLRELSDARRPRVPGAGRVPCAVRFLSQYLRTRTYRGHGLGRRARRPQFRANKFREGLGSEIFSSRSNFVSLLAGGVARPVQVMVKRRSFRKDSQGQNSGDFLKRVTPF